VADRIPVGPDFWGDHMDVLQYTDFEPLRVGVIGGGYIGTTVGAEFYATPLAEVAAIADVNESTLADAGRLLAVQAAHQYTDYETMLAGEDLDAVLVGTPHTFHYEQVRTGLEAGLDVLCDKPLTTDLEQARELVELAEAGDEVLMVGYQRHLNPAYRRARERWRADSTPRFVTAEITQNWANRHEGTWRTDPELSGGGYLYDTGSHLLDALLWTTGLTPSHVRAEMEFADDDRRVDTRTAMTIDFENGAVATVSLWADAPCVREHFHAWDEDGAIYLEGRQWERRTLKIVESDSTTSVPYFNPSDQPTKAEAFVEAVHRDIEPPATARDALAVTAVSEAAYESARTGERIPVGV
jgi:predicted dehydrogenase